MDDRIRKDLSRLLNFRFSLFGTKGLAQVAYALLFGLLSVQLILSIAWLVSFAQATTNNGGVQFLIILFGFAFIALDSLLILALGRIVLEFFVLQFSQGDLGKEQELRESREPSGSATDENPPVHSFAKVQPLIQEGEWRCRCGTVNEPQASECANCKRAPNAIY